MSVSEPLFHVDALVVAPLATLTLHGELDIDTVDELRRDLPDLQDRGLHRVTVDLRDLTFVDSSGLRAFSDLDGEARRDGHELVFLRATDRVHRAFELVGLDDRLVFVDEPGAMRPLDA